MENVRDICLKGLDVSRRDCFVPTNLQVMRVMVIFGVAKREKTNVKFKCHCKTDWKPIGNFKIF